MAARCGCWSVCRLSSGLRARRESATQPVAPEVRLPGVRGVVVKEPNRRGHRLPEPTLPGATSDAAPRPRRRNFAAPFAARLLASLLLLASCRSNGAERPAASAPAWLLDRARQEAE